MSLVCVGVSSNAPTHMLCSLYFFEKKFFGEYISSGKAMQLLLQYVTILCVVFATHTTLLLIRFLCSEAWVINVLGRYELVPQLMLRGSLIMGLVGGTV